jgi:hypothetical protein
LIRLNTYLPGAFDSCFIDQIERAFVHELKQADQALQSRNFDLIVAVLVFDLAVDFKHDLWVLFQDIV